MNIVAPVLDRMRIDLRTNCSDSYHNFKC